MSEPTPQMPQPQNQLLTLPDIRNLSESFLEMGLRKIGIDGIELYSEDKGDTKYLAPLEPGDSYLLIKDRAGSSVVVRGNELRKSLSLEPKARTMALAREALENLELAKTVRKYDEDLQKGVGYDKELAHNFNTHQNIICGGPCAIFIDRLLERFPLGKYEYNHLVEITNAVADRADKVAENVRDFIHKQPFTKYVIASDLPTVEFEYDYGPPKLPSDALWFLQNTVTTLKDGNVRSVEEIPGDNKAVKLTFNDGTTGRIKISRLLDTLPPTIREAIQRAMTKQLPHGIHRVQVKISIDPLDIVAKSTGQGWKSCETLGGIYSDGIYDDIRNINAIAIVRTAPLGKPFPKQWTSRFMLRWCDVDGASKKPDVGIEPRAYGGNEKLNEMAMKKVTEALEKDGYLGYRLCVTPYEYYGYSDQAALFTDKAAGYEIAYGPDAKNYYIEKHGISEIDFQDYYHEYDYYGVCLRLDGDFENLYYEGILAELLEGDWSPDVDFARNTACQIISDLGDPEQWAEYLKWKELREILPDAEYWLYELPEAYEIPDRFLHRYTLYRKGGDRIPDAINQNKWRLIPIQFEYEPGRGSYNTLDLHDGNIGIMHDAFFNLQECCDGVNDDANAKRISEEDANDRYAKCIYDWREKLLKAAGMGDAPDDKLRMDIPTDFNEAVKKFEQMDLTGVCEDLARGRRSFKEGQNMTPNNYLNALLYEDRPPSYSNIFHTTRSATIPNRDTDEPCGELMPLMYHCKLPLFVHGDPVFDDGKGVWVDSGYRSVPFEVWSKDPKYRCELEGLEGAEESQ